MYGYACILKVDQFPGEAVKRLGRKVQCAYITSPWIGRLGFFFGLWHTATYIHQIAICDNTCVSVYLRTGPSSRHHWWPMIEKQSCSRDAKDTSRINHRMKRKQEIDEIWPQNRPWNSLRYPRKRPRGANCVGNEKEQNWPKIPTCILDPNWAPEMNQKEAKSRPPNGNENAVE